MSAHKSELTSASPGTSYNTGGPTPAERTRATTEPLRPHGSHPVGVAAFLMLLIAFGSLGVWLATLASGATAWAIAFGIVALVGFIVSLPTLMVMSHRLHHSGLVPDPTLAEEREYLRDHRAPRLA